MINILFCGNKGVFDGVLTTTLSILKRTTTKEPFNIYLFTMDVSHIDPKYVPIPDEHVQFLQSVIKEYNPENIVTKINVDKYYQEDFANCPNESAYCSPYTLIRLFADQIPNIPEKLLYLDCDIMLNRDICELYNIDISDYEFAAAPDHYGKYLIRPDYINAGVLLFNVTKCKETGLFQKARDNIKRKKWMFADQDALWHAASKKKMLPQKFNDQKFLHPKSTVIRHFSKRLFYLPYPHTDNIKQWHITKVHKVFGYDQFDDILYEYVYLKTKFEKENNR